MNILSKNMYNTSCKPVFNTSNYLYPDEKLGFYTFSTEFSTLFRECLSFPHSFPPLLITNGIKITEKGDNIRKIGLEGMLKACGNCDIKPLSTKNERENGND